jgi:RNA polymerase sigma factor (sigma-70 family)
MGTVPGILWVGRGVLCSTRRRDTSGRVSRVDGHTAANSHVSQERLSDIALARAGETPARDALEQQFVQNLTLIERIAGSICRRHGLDQSDADDFVSWLRVKLIEDGYAVFAKFRGESALATYLTVVIAMQFRDYRVQRWGRWRASAAALRRGALAVRLETLVRRDRMSLQQAGELLRTRGETTESDAELGRLLQALPDRAPLRPEESSSERLLEAPGTSSADDLVTQRELGEERAAAERALASAIAEESAEDQVILRMRFWEGSSVADIARALRVEQKPLYRRLERALGNLRRRLELQGISAAQVRALLEDETKVP